MSDIRVKTNEGWKDAKGTPDGKVLTAGSLKTVLAIKGLAAAANYEAEDVMSEATAASTFWHFPHIGLNGYIVKAQCLNETTALTPRVTVFLYRRPPTVQLLDGVANTGPSLDDLSFYEGKLDFMAWEDLGGVSESLITPSTVGNLPIAYTTDTGRFIAIVVTRDAITGEAAGMKLMIKITVEQY